jgi:hypothetical protein
VIFSSIGVITGVWADTFDLHAFVASVVGGVFNSARSLGEPWSTLTRVDPIYYPITRVLKGGFRAGLARAFLDSPTICRMPEMRRAKR